MPSFRRLNQLPHIRLRDPLLHDTFAQGKYTTYKIIIETEHHAFHLRSSCIRRRYSELRWLCSTLLTHHKQIKLPNIPSKKIWSERFNSSFVSTRMREIEVFLNELIKMDSILSDTALHLFLQTDMTVDEMNDYLNGKADDNLMEEVWASQGHLHTPNELGTFMSIATPREIEMDSEDEMLATSNPESTISTHFTNINDNFSLPSSSPTKTTTATMTSPKVGFPTQPDNDLWVPQIPELNDNSSLNSKPSEADSESTSTVNTIENPLDNEISGKVSIDNDTEKGQEESDRIVESSEYNTNNDSASVVTTSTDDSTRNSSPALSDEAQSNSVPMSTSSD